MKTIRHFAFGSLVPLAMSACAIGPADSSAVPTSGPGSGSESGSGAGSGSGSGGGSSSGGASVSFHGVRPKPSASDGGASDTGGNGNPGTNDQCLFPCDGPWYKDVSALPAYAGEDIIGEIGAWGRGNKLWIDFAFVPLVANAATPRYTFQLDSSYDPDNDHDPVPVPPNGALEGENGYACTTGGDCHLLVVDTSAHKLFELWQANLSNGQWKATQQTTWDLTKHYGPEGRGSGCTSSDAAGLSILAGLLRPAEVASGEIKHAIRFILPGNKIKHNGYVAPATHSTGVYSGSAPMGTRLRLKPTFNEASLPTSGAKVVARALKKYGMILADAGQDALTAERDDVSPVKWSGMLNAGDLAGLKVTDFEVVDFGAVHVPASMDCTRVF